MSAVRRAIPLAGGRRIAALAGDRPPSRHGAGSVHPEGRASPARGSAPLARGRSLRGLRRLRRLGLLGLLVSGLVLSGPAPGRLLSRPALVLLSRLTPGRLRCLGLPSHSHVVDEIRVRTPTPLRPGTGLRFLAGSQALGFTGLLAGIAASPGCFRSLLARHVHRWCKLSADRTSPCSSVALSLQPWPPCTVAARSGVSLNAAPSCPRRGAGNLAAAFRAEGRRAGRTTFETAQPPERGRVRVHGRR